jgi:hypothetical protein
MECSQATIVGQQEGEYYPFPAAAFSHAQVPSSMIACSIGCNLCEFRQNGARIEPLAE